MGEEDIHHLLFRNQNIGIIEKHHAVIMFNPSPYRTVQEYMERITRQTSKIQPQHMATIHNILEYTFVLQVSFLSELPSNYASSVVDLNVSRYFVENKQDTHNLHYTSIIRDVLQMLLYTNNNSSSCPNTETLKKSLRQIAFRSPAGWILIGKENLVHFEYKLYDFNPTSQEFELVLQLSPYGSNYKLVLNVIQAIFWPNGLKIYPDPCFKTKENCIESDMSPLLISLISTSVIGVLSLICLLYMMIRRYFLQRQVEKGPNKIVLHNDDLIFVHRKKSTKIPKSTTLFGKPDLLRGSEPSNSMSTLNEISEFSETARYNGDMIYVKDLKIKHSDMKSRPKLMSHLKLLRELRHENLNPFIGFLNDPARPSFITEYCTRGSLEDVICNFDIKLDWEFKLSLLTDLVRGLRYIQSCPLRYHGNLKSRNCVIDSRWVLKITDYGIPGMLEGGKADRNLTAEEIIQKVKKPPPLIRPSVSPQAAPPHYIQLMKQCWAENPDMRPDIESIYHQFKEFNNGRKQNFVDTMFKMLEKYSTDLEDIVRERTMQLEEEKKKTDELLYRMLPSSVAECLKCGRRIEAENYSDVTIYFSDIVGFTSISAMSTAMEVVNILNELYTMFDATIDNYDVYKVETIGDAYMVVSGLPERNGIKHAGEIGTMALDLLYQCGNLRVNHLWNMPLLLRIGLHTGPCAAGVVGLRMPRYCLFGDTVNTASRMESTGLPFRIHLSGCTKAKLDELGGYKFKYRGEVELKGKGIANTYWLVGKEGFDKKLPADPTKGMSGMSSSQLIEELMRISKEAAEKEEQIAASNKAVPVVIESPTSNTAETSPVASNTRSDVSKTSPTVSHQIFTNASVHDDGRDLVAIHTRTGSQKGTSLFNDLECLDTRPIARNTSYATGICKSWGNITKVDNMALHSGDRMQTPGIVKSALRRISSHKFDKRESKLALPRRGSTPKATDGLELKVVLSKSDQIFHPDTLRPVFTHKGGSFRRVDPIDTKFSCSNKDKNNSVLKNTKPSCEPEKHNTKEMLLISRDASRKCASDQPIADTGRSHSKKESRKIKALDTTAVFPVETISVISKPELFEQKDTSPKKSSPLKHDKNEENMAGDICNFSNPKV
ncbi:retinal guanylyl cyclase 2-like [Octopus vulgaris]|uniref:Guanylate cyclase n=1 Tax=Octopus vulgaris TaxID=6645 RepID=A0AA36AQQ2_OCTVU|nr:retinal guanylyl cyclase 2-like [Octopus vulgaris]